MLGGHPVGSPTWWREGALWSPSCGPQCLCSPLLCSTPSVQKLCGHGSCVLLLSPPLHSPHCCFRVAGAMNWDPQGTPQSLLFLQKTRPQGRVAVSNAPISHRCHPPSPCSNSPLVGDLAILTETYQEKKTRAKSRVVPGCSLAGASGLVAPSRLLSVLGLGTVRPGKLWPSVRGRGLGVHLCGWGGAPLPPLATGTTDNQGEHLGGRW